MIVDSGLSSQTPETQEPARKHNTSIYLHHQLFSGSTVNTQLCEEILHPRDNLIYMS